MGALRLPEDGSVYIDAQISIYTVDRHPLYAPLCRPIWEAVKTGTLTAVTSELTLLETLVVPLRKGDDFQASRRVALWRQANTRMIPVAREILLEAARLRAATPAIKTPDAIHAATALLHNCSVFITNDVGFRRILGLRIILLDEALASP